MNGFLLGFLLLLAAASAAADPLVRRTSELEQVPIQGITLSMTSRQAFDVLLAAGYRAGSLESYEDWRSDGAEFVRGEYGSAAGYSSVQIGRRGERIVSISESFNSPGNPIDAIAAIGSVQRQLGIPADEENCRVRDDHAGLCEVRDAVDGAEASVLFTLQILTVMRLASISRRHELKAE